MITDKSSDLSARTSEINRVAEEIQRVKELDLVIVHGGGSFGHPSAQKYSIKEGFEADSQKIGFCETHHLMTVLNGLVMDSLIWHDIPAVSVSPSSCIMTEKGRIKHFEDASLRSLLKMGFVPVLYGDAVMDYELGFTILSGDQLVSDLAMRFDAGRIIMGVDVDGLYDSDPKRVKAARLYRHLTMEELRRLSNKIGEPTSPDVTGGMFGKIAEIFALLERNVQVLIVNASTPNNLYKALMGETTRGTVIEKE